MQIYGSDFKDNISKNYIIDNDSNLSIFNTNFIENKVDDAVIYNNGEHCIVENGTFENNLSHGDAKNIYNDGELTLKNPKINDENKTIFNDSWGHILIKNSPPNLSDKIDGDGEVVVENSMIPKVKTFDFGHLDRIIHKSNEKEIFLEDDILFENYEKEYYEGGIELDIDDLVIDGNGKTIDGDGKSRIFTVTGKNITLKNITFKNGKSHKNYDNKLNNHGGVLRITKGANLTVKNCKFLNNTSEEYGGAISNSGELNICESQISHNISKSHGGAIFNYHGKLKLSKSVLSDNDGNKKGGAIYNVYADLKMTNSMLSENSVTGSGGGGIGSYGLGGAIYSEDSDMDISESTLSNNYAASEGGAIYNSEGNLLMRKSTISKNKVGNSNFSGAVHSSEKGIDKIFKFITQEIGARSVSNTEYFNVDEIGNHILKGINLKDCTFKKNDPYDLAIGAISHEYLNEFSSQLGYSVYDKVMLERND